MLVKTEGIVLKEIRFKETSKILTVFSRKFGKINVMAKGAYRPKSVLTGSTQVFSYCNFTLFKGRNFYYMNQGDIIDSFYSLRENMSRLMYGSYLLELSDYSIMEEESNERLFLLLIKGLNVLSNLESGFLKFVISFEIKHISFVGYRPCIDKCVVCGSEDIKDMKFSYKQGGIICKRCYHTDPYCEDMNGEMLIALKALLYSPLDKVENIKIPKDVTIKLHEIMVKYILINLDRKCFNSLSTIKSIKNNGGF